MTDDMELMDWKEIEGGAEQAIRQAWKDTTIANILLTKARKRIKELGGKTNQEIDDEAREKQREAKRKSAI